MMLVRNEQDRWLEQVLQQHRRIADRIVILDDNSTDNTYNICKEYTKEVYSNEKCMWESNEWEARKKLWEITKRKVAYGDIILCVDADELFDIKQLNIINPALRYFNDHDTATSYGFRLYDMWDDHHYRDDAMWSAHKRIWKFAIKFMRNTEYIWNQNKLHCGRFPLFKDDRMLGSKIRIKHMGWSTPEDRQKKYDRYMTVDPDGQYGIMAQYKSILDENPRLVRFD